MMEETTMHEGKVAGSHSEVMMDKVMMDGSHEGQKKN